VLTPASLPELQRAIAEADLDGWLLFDFQGCNPIAGGLLGLEGMVTRRIFVWIPREGVPAALGHAIEPGPWRTWPAPWQHATYSSWRDLERAVGGMVQGRRIAMEYSPGDAVPYLDRVPAGVLEMVRAAGAREIVSSGELVSRFVASWTAAHLASHRRAAAAIRQIALDAFALVGERTRSGRPIAEHEVMAWILDRFAGAGLSTDHGPNVSAGPNAANPHYEPSADRPRPIVSGDVLLIDLWARETDGADPAAGVGETRERPVVGVWADQTWMATVGAPSARAQEIWSAIRDARDAAIRKVTDDVAAGRTLHGGDVDDVARAVIDARGLGRYFTHRTGHSIDPRSLHGAGPHLDNLETREQRLLIPGVGFSIEPGVYVPGEIGMRTEVNAFIENGRAVITPDEYQRELIVL
jgi:Xaa-Pro aminopeptidase